MIRHTILFKIKLEISKEVSKKAFANFISLKNMLPDIITMIGGECELYEGKGGDIFTHAFSIDFKNREAAELFFNDSITHAAKADIINIVDGGYEGLLGFDLEY